MTDDKKYNSTDILPGIVERLIDNLQETNTSNTDMLRSINISLTKVSDTIPTVVDEIGIIKEEIRKFEGNDVVNGIRSILTKIKILIAVFSIIITLGVIISSLTQFKLETSIINGIKLEMRENLKEHTENMKQQLELFLSRNGK